MSPSIQAFFEDDTQWRAAYAELRDIISSTNLFVEEYKWYKPCYTVDGENVVLIHGFKDFCALLFFKGVLMDDPRELLVAQTEHVQVRRQLRFTSVERVREMKQIISEYLGEAVRIERSGRQVVLKETSDYAVPEELLEKFEEMPELQEAFEALTPGRQRGYLLFFNGAKLSATRAARIEKNIDKIMDGIGLQDR